MPAKYVPITGQVLTWAMDDAGLDSEELADGVGASVDEVLNWRKDLQSPTTGQFHRLAKALGRPESFFFLPEPPSRQATVASFRRRPGATPESGNLTAETAEGLRIAERVQRTVAWIAERSELPAASVPPAGYADDPEQVAAVLREWLDWSVQEQTRDGATESSVSREIRARLQERGIIVLNLTLDENVVRGLSLPHDQVPVIAVNTRDPQRARIFSYFHELAHLALRENYLCFTKSHDGIEAWCNRVAAAALLPRAHFRKTVWERHRDRLVSEISEVSALRSTYKVSMRALAVRLEELQLGIQGLYEKVNRQTERKSKGGTYDPDRVRIKPRVRLETYGRGYINSLTDAEDAGVLPRFQVLRLLRVSEGELHQMREMAATGAEG
jgi:Zn-dependent peptidase ImmA (M78 family)/transcriptional regulator with XRE-family HTH domain